MMHITLEIGTWPIKTPIYGVHPRARYSGRSCLVVKKNYDRMRRPLCEFSAWKFPLCIWLESSSHVAADGRLCPQTSIQPNLTVDLAVRKRSPPCVPGNRWIVVCRLNKMPIVYKSYQAWAVNLVFYLICCLCSVKQVETTQQSAAPTAKLPFKHWIQEWGPDCNTITPLALRIKIARFLS